MTQRSSPFARCGSCSSVGGQHRSSSTTAWLLNVTVILLPIGIKLINLVPTVLTLAEPRSLSEPESARGQRSLTVRAVYFVLVGWWLSLLWANVASFLAITVGLPVAIWMLNRLPYVTSLYRFHG